VVPATPDTTGRIGRCGHLPCTRPFSCHLRGGGDPLFSYVRIVGFLRARSRALRNPTYELYSCTGRACSTRGRSTLRPYGYSKWLAYAHVRQLFAGSTDLGHAAACPYAQDLRGLPQHRRPGLDPGSRTDGESSLFAPPEQLMETLLGPGSAAGTTKHRRQTMRSAAHTKNGSPPPRG